MIPNAIPSVQNTAIAESSRISLRLLSHSTPKADSTANTPAARIGEHQSPRYDIRTDKSANNACQQTADEGMLKEGVLQ